MSGSHLIPCLEAAPSFKLPVACLHSPQTKGLWHAFKHGSGNHLGPGLGEPLDRGDEELAASAGGGSHGPRPVTPHRPRPLREGHGGAGPEEISGSSAHDRGHLSQVRTLPQIDLGESDPMNRRRRVSARRAQRPF